VQLKSEDTHNGTVRYQNCPNACCRHARIGRSGRVMRRLGQAASRSQVLRRQGCSGVEKAIPGYDHTMSTDELSFDQRGLPVMSLVRVHNFCVSLDGFGTGADQGLEAPFGHAGDRLVRWFTGTRSFHVMQGQQGGSTGIDDAFASNWGPGIGVEIMGRNKFGPQRGPWTDEEWKGWWGEEPPFHTPVFVLTHHVRPSIEMKGGTTFHFIDASPAQALAAARQAAGGLDVRIGGGPATIRQFLAAGLIDHMHIALVPILLGRGESLWDGLEGLEERFAIESVSSPSGVTHVTFTRRSRA
jgi:dihydrofolate reductase